MKTVFHNFSALSAIQVANYVFPLVTVPYLGRVLGAEKFGLIAFAQSFVLFFAIVTRYGFNLSATRRISIDREDPIKLGRTYCEVIAVKLWLTLLLFAGFAALIYLVPRFRNEPALYLLSYGFVLGDALFPIWFFQGMERMKPMALFNLVSQAVFTAGVFILVRERGDYLWVAVLHSTGFIVSGVVAQIYLLRTFSFPKHWPGPRALVAQLKDGWHFFVSSVALNLFTGANTFLLGLLTNDLVVGYFSGAEKIIRAVLGLLSPLVQAVYPRISKLASEAYAEGHRLFLFFRRVMIGFTGLLSLGTALTAHWAVALLLGPGFEESIIVLQVLSPLPVLVGIATAYTNLFLVGFGYSRIWSRIIVFTSLVSMAGVFLFVKVLEMDAVGVAVNMLLTECLVIGLSYRQYRIIHKRRSV
ncbi:MAG: flippase [Acidobacteriota bacterium]|nr:flippase [Acidobacteriota bacterium]